MHVAFLHAAAGHGHGEDARPVVAAVRAVDLRRAAELGADQHERALEQAAVGEVGDEAGEGLVELGGLVLEAALDVGVVVPAAEGDGDHAHAGLDEAAGEEETLAGGVPAVFVAELVRTPCERSKAWRALALLTRP